ncbi:glycosyltransferase [Nocardioides panaciterrulae]|uniref:Glycosyltransferase involved in cell wall biosynthesis n=1 Tax=Nocardioides panaciterrulae TaxID=661492 RepID=A0A7Y9JA11_9ACTN|nr:glycosyltransferase involved in cell wall biosynthesis [Nocardioides panaciterrulae]
MRILHVTDHFPPVLGGIETHVAQLAAHQAARGDEVTVLTSTPDTVVDGRRAVDPDGVRVRRARSTSEVFPFDFDDHDVVHAHISVLAPFTSRVAAVAARRGVPTVVTVHSFWDGWGPVATLAADVAGLRSAPVGWSAVSGVAAAQVARRLPGGVEVAVLPNAVDVPAREHTPDGLGRPVRLVSTMRLARRKQPLQLLEAFALLRRRTDLPVTLTVVGDGPLMGRVARRVRRADLRGAVDLVGRLEPVEVQQVLRDSDVYVAPAPLESFGLAALEARCVGLPVVARSGSGVQDFVREDVEGWLVPDRTALVERLRILVDQPAVRLRVAEHNRSTPAGFTWGHALVRTDELYARTRTRVGALVAERDGSP